MLSNSFLHPIGGSANMKRQSLKNRLKKEHHPPHFHAKYNEFRAEILIETLSLKEGKLPPRILGLVTEWAEKKN